MSDIRTFAFVSRNEGKFREIISILKNSPMSGKLKIVMTDLPKVEIQSDRLEDVALYAAEHLRSMGYRNFLLEDSGLFIDALNGFPGPYSSYVFRTIGCKGILKLLSGVPESERGATFKSVIAADIDGHLSLFIGTVKGKIATEERGSHGFGFDPIFIPEGADRTFAEMDTSTKNKYSHRARAFSRFLSFLSKSDEAQA